MTGTIAQPNGSACRSQAREAEPELFEHDNDEHRVDQKGRKEKSDRVCMRLQNRESIGYELIELSVRPS